VNKPNIKAKRGPERQIQDDLIAFLKIRDWFVFETHGNMYQRGLPDLYIAKRSFGPRWIEVKNRDKFNFTGAQLETFPLMQAAGVGIWILTAASEFEYSKLFRPPNWYTFLDKATL